MTTTQEFCVRWNTHLGSIGAVFPQLLAIQRFVDVTLVCDGHQLRCHRLVLAACSSYFETILAENPCKHPVIILPREVQLWEIQALVDFMYKGEVNVTQAGLGQLLRCAQHLRIRGLYGSEVPYKPSQRNGDYIADSLEKELSVKRQLSLTPKEKESELRSHQQIRTNGENLENWKSLEKSFHIVPAKKTAILPIIDNCDDKFCATNGNCFGKLCDFNLLEDENMCSQPSNLQTRQQHECLQHHSLESTCEEDHNYFTTQEEKSISGTLSCVLPLNMKVESPNNVSTLLRNSSIDGLISYKRVRRPEASLAQAAKYISKGRTFQTVSNMFNIPVSTIRFYMARKGILPKRKRGRGASHVSNVAIPSHAEISQHNQVFSDSVLKEESTNSILQQSTNSKKYTKFTIF
ncbi:uncharacterized protein [Drosophila bipectinata]|uniref:uncharacterized protein isoform X2 n=1 Tax=Drosophila bipectinata TaxID=42026 RepID=UPI0038B2F474